MLKIRNKTSRLGSEVRAGRDVVQHARHVSMEGLRFIFKEQGFDLLDLIMFGGFWCYAVTTDGTLWLNDFSHGGGGKFKPVSIGNNINNHEFKRTITYSKVSAFVEKFLNAFFEITDGEEVTFDKLEAMRWQYIKATDENYKADEIGFFIHALPHLKQGQPVYADDNQRTV